APLPEELLVESQGRAEQIGADGAEARDIEQLALAHDRERVIDGLAGAGEVGIGGLRLLDGLALTGLGGLASILGDAQWAVDPFVRQDPEAQERRQEQQDRRREYCDRRPASRPLDASLPERDRPRDDRLAVEEPSEVSCEHGGRVIALPRLLLQAFQRDRL